jgi:hypothetical protein
MWVRDLRQLPTFRFSLAVALILGFAAGSWTAFPLLLARHCTPNVLNTASVGSE